MPGEGGCRPSSPLPELLEDHTVGEALAADPDALENPIAAQLVQHQVGIQFASLDTKTQACGLASAPGNSGTEAGRAPLDSIGQKSPGATVAHRL